MLLSRKLRKTTKILSQDVSTEIRNPAPPEYNSEALALEPGCSVTKRM
jgi:hypothetical protein